MAIKIYRKFKTESGECYLMPIGDITDPTFHNAVCEKLSTVNQFDEFFIYDQSNGKVLSRYINGQVVDP